MTNVISTRPTSKDILNFIGRFRLAAGNNIAMFDCVGKLFTCGACYWFAEILYQRFYGGAICYDPIEGHFIWRYDNICYDINGIYKKNLEKVVSLGTIKSNDYLHYERLMRDCRDFSWEEEEEQMEEDG